MSIRDKAGLPPVAEEPLPPLVAKSSTALPAPSVPGAHSAALQALSAAKQALMGSLVAIEAAERLLQSPPPRFAPTLSPQPEPTPREQPPTADVCTHPFTQRLDAMGATVFLCVDCGEQVES